MDEVIDHTWMKFEFETVWTSGHQLEFMDEIGAISTNLEMRDPVRWQVIT